MTKGITTISLDIDLIEMAKQTGINISRVANDSLKDILSPFQTPEILAITKEIDDLQNKINNLQCRKSSILTEARNYRNFKSIFLKYDENHQWSRDWRSGNVDIAQIEKKTGIPRDWLTKILDDLTSQVRS